MKDSVLRDYHASRDFAGKAFRSSCYAPFISLFFDTQGNVQACCQNVKYPLGNIAHDRLLDVWHGKPIETLRKALKKDNFAAGCQFCEWQISVGNFGGVYTRNFEQFPVSDPSPEWPVMMEFSISNTCNLECVMCKGEFSSLIRSNREKLPPMPKAYGEAFFADLRQFLPHLRYCKFLGGEPFLARESYHIWDMMMEDRLRIPCHVTTNGTQYNDRVAEVLDKLPISFSVSVDGMTKRTVESIRVNAPFETVMENFRRFHAYARRQGTYIGLTYCLMRQNWHEFGDFLLFADDWDCEVVVNLVREPPGCSLYTLPLRELSRIADSLEQQSAQIRRRLGRNRGVWDEHVGGLRRRVERREDSTRPPFDTPLALVVLDSKSRLAVPEAERVDVARAEAILSRWAGTAERRQFTTDQDDRLQDLADDQTDVFGVPWTEVRGRLFEDLIERLRDRYGEDRVVTLEQSGHYVDRVHEFQAPDGGIYSVRTISVPRLSVFSLPEGAVTLSAAVWVGPEAGTLSPAEATAWLSHWAGTAPLVELEVDRSGLFVSGSGSGWPALGIEPAEWRGRPLEEWFFPLRGRFGEERAVERWDDELNHFDRLVRFRTPTGPAHGRLIALRRFDAEGRPIGWRVLLAVVVIERERQPFSAAQARARLAEWAPHGEIVELDVDFPGRIERVAGRVPLRLPVAPNEVVGQKLADAGQLLSARLGRARQLNLRKAGYVSDRIWSFATESGPWMVRSLRIPRFAESGKFVGWQVLVALDEVVAARVPHDPSAWDAELRRWSGHPEVLRLESDRNEIVQQVSGRLTPDDPEGERRWVGHPHSDVPALLADRLGRQTDWELSVQAHRTVAVLEFQGPQGPQFVRCVDVPRFGADGTWLGYAVLLALRRLDPQAVAAASESAQLALSAWGADDGVSLAARADLAGRVGEWISAPAANVAWLSEACTGRTLSDLAARGPLPHGQAELRHNRRDYFRHDQVWDVVAPDGPWTIRWHWLPEFVEGVCRGWRIQARAARLSDCRLPSDESLQAELRAWSTSGAVLQTVISTNDRIDDVSGELPPLSHLTPADLRGQPSSLVASRIEETFGPGRVYDVVERAVYSDRIWYHVGPRGPVFVRAVRRPRLTGAGGFPDQVIDWAVAVVADDPGRPPTSASDAPLAGETPGVRQLIVEADVAGRITRVTAEPKAAFDAREAELCGQDQAQVTPWLTRLVGPTEELARNWTRFRLDEVSLAETRGQAARVRRLLEPRFDDDGHWLGWRETLIVAPLDESTLAGADQAALEWLRQWAPQGIEVELTSDASGRIVEAGGAALAWLNVTAAELCGQTLEHLSQLYAERLGTPRLTGLERTALVEDRVIEFTGPRGPVLCRALSYPSPLAQDQHLRHRARFRTLAEAPQVATEDDARSALAAWSAEAVVWQLDTDLARVFVGDVPPSSDPLELRREDPTGRTWTELCAAWTARWGASRVVMENRQPDREEELRELYTDRGPVEVRSFATLRFNAQGEALGWRRLVGIVAVTRDSRKATPESIERQVRDWGGGGPLLRIRTDRRLRVLSAELTDPDADLPAAELVGHSVEELPNRFAARWGAWELFNDVRTSDLSDNTLEFPQAATRRQIRGLQIPDFDESGHWVGYQVRAALVALPPPNERLTSAQGDAWKQAWDHAADQTWLFANTLGVAQHVDRDPNAWTGLDWPGVIGRPWLSGVRAELLSGPGAAIVRETWRGNVLEGEYQVPTAAGTEHVRVRAEPRAGDDGTWIGWVVLILSRRAAPGEAAPLASPPV